MKKLILIAAVILIAGSTSCQTLPKGTCFGLHVVTINLDPNATLNQFLDVWKNKVVPEYAKNFQADFYLIKGIRGESENCFGAMMVFKSVADRDKYFKSDGSFTETGQAAYDKMKPVMDELAKLGKTTSKYTDWVIQ
jgi:cytochrome oxidase Cu insertion factor (SCO1/SenC/PrrC family)